MRSNPAFRLEKIVASLLLTLPLWTQPTVSADKQVRTFSSHIPGEVATGVVIPKGVAETASTQMEGDIAVIVQMRDAPILKVRKALSGLSPEERARQLRQHMDSLKVFHATLKAWIKGEEPGLQDKAFKDYLYTFNGLATSVKAKTLEKMRKRSDVAHVHRDGKVGTFLVNSVPHIGADQIQNAFGADGRGIRVAVIDTGIDYTHADLGGGFGPGFKIIGGYDFVNQDGDPRDDNGHGTHVAGIIAANGAVKGVAPGANLVAFKVLDAGGSGSFSTVILGIERAVDPDQDPATEDGVHVISMSLGGWGDPSDAISQAVDTAAEAGVVCAIAAGNAGNGYSSIQSPGCARRALTVGASDIGDAIAAFSSRGPNKADFSIKPDVIAPGVSITSTYLNGGYASLSGTSMATPHVAGLAALLRQLHPAWTPEDVKGVLSEKGKPLGLDAFTQGGGRIQSVPSHLAKAVLIPNSLCFGVDDLSQGTWTKTMTIQIKSLDPTPRSYSLGIQGAVPIGASWILDPASVNLEPGQTVTVNATLSLDNASLPDPTSTTLAYEARLVATATDDTLTIPVVFYKAGLLNLSFDGEPWTVMIDDQDSDPNDGFGYLWIPNPGPSYSAMVPPRNYNVVCLYPQGPTGDSAFSFIVRENIEVKGTTHLSINLAREAVHQITLSRRDPDGNEMPTWAAEPAGAALFFGYQSNLWGSLTYGGLPHVYYFSNISSRYKFDLIFGAWSNQGTKKFYEFAYGLRDGIIQSAVIQNAAIYKKIKLNYDALDPALDSLWLLVYVGFNTPSGAFQTTGWNCNLTNSVLTARPFEVEAYLPVLPYPEFTFNASWHTANAWKGALPYCNGDTGGNWLTLLRGGLLGIQDPTTVNIYEWLSPYVPFLVPFLSTTAPSLQIGESPHFWSAKMDYWDGNPFIYFRSAHGWLAPLYMTQTGDGMVADLPYQLVRGAQIIQSGTMANTTWQWIPFSNASPGAYALRVPYDAYFVNGLRGNALATLSFDTSNPRDKVPPYLKRLAILKDGQASSLLNATGQNTLSVEVEDDVALGDLKFSYQTPMGWQLLALETPSGSTAHCTVALPGGLPDGPVNLQIIAKDAEGNTLTYELSPAFHFSGNLPPSTPTVPNGPPQALKDTSCTFTTTATDDGASVRYTFDWGDATSTTTAFLPSGTSASAPHAWTSTGVFQVRAKAEDSKGSSSAWSGAFPVTITQDTQAPAVSAVETGASGTISLSATATDNIGVTKVEFYVNGTLAGAVTAAPYTLTMDSRALPNGTHTLVAKAYDAADNVGTSPQVTFTVNNLIKVSISPTRSTLSPGTTQQFLATVTGNTDTSVIWTLQEGASGGTITTSGLYTAPKTAGTYHVVATSNAASAKSAVATVRVKNR